MARIRQFLFVFSCVLVTLLSAIGLSVVIKFVVWMVKT